MEEAVLKYVGFAWAARALAVGTDLVLTAVRQRRARLVLLAADVSGRTEKQILDKCSYYHVEVRRLRCTMDALARAMGKQAPVAAAAVTDSGFAASIRQACTDTASTDAE